MKFERTKVYNLEEAIYGMRLPLMSHDKSDSALCGAICCEDCQRFSEELDCMDFILGKNDLDLAQRLITAGPEHRKFMRQIMVSVTITAPLYWWKEFDTYKVGTTANSSSTMHKLASTPITMECFETDDYNKDLTLDVPGDPYLTVEKIKDTIIEALEGLREEYLNTKDKRYWKELVRWLPNGWLQTRTITMNYENLRSMYSQRKSHKLTEWHKFCSWVEFLPYSKELILYR